MGILSVFVFGCCFVVLGVWLVMCFPVFGVWFVMCSLLVLVLLVLTYFEFYRVNMSCGLVVFVSSFF